MEKLNADRISEALEIWVGPIPALGYDREAALVERFGAQAAKELVAIVRALQQDFYGTNAGAVAPISAKCTGSRWPTSSVSIPRSRIRPPTLWRPGTRSRIAEPSARGRSRGARSFSASASA